MFPLKFTRIFVIAWSLLSLPKTDLQAQPTDSNLPAASKHPELRFEQSVPAMGSHVDFVVYAQSESDAQKVIGDGLAEIERLSKVLSNYDSESEISKLCSAPKDAWTSLSPDLTAVLVHSRRWHQLSLGKFDITVGPLTQLWRAQRKRKQLPTQRAVADAKERSGWNYVDLDLRLESEARNEHARASLRKDQMLLDLSGIAVGYILDAAFEKMKNPASNSILINAGGDIRVGDAPPNTRGWRIVIAGLGKDSPPLSKLEISNCAITTSGDLNQYVEIDGRRYSHFIDPSNGEPIERRQSVTVIAATTVDADAGATALAVLGMDQASEHFDRMPITQAVILEAGAADGPVRLRWLTQSAN